MNLEPDEREMLKLAMGQAEAQLASLLNDQQDLERNPPELPAHKLVQGRLAMENAVASARRMVTALHDAWELAARSAPEFEHDPETDS